MEHKHGGNESTQKGSFRSPLLPSLAFKGVLARDSSLKDASRHDTVRQRPRWHLSDQEALATDVRDPPTAPSAREATPTISITPLAYLGLVFPSGLHNNPADDRVEFAAV